MQVAMLGSKPAASRAERLAAKKAASKALKAADASVCYLAPPMVADLVVDLADLKEPYSAAMWVAERAGETVESKGYLQAAKRVEWTVVNLVEQKVA